MLCLSRHKDERIRIGNEITLTVLRIQGDRVVLGIDAPDHVNIYRQEVYDAIQSEKEEPKCSQPWSPILRRH